MKPLKVVLLALALLLLFAPAALTGAGSHQPAPGTATIAMAMEPASWVFVAFGLVGGGFAHRRRLAGLHLLKAGESLTAPQPESTSAKMPQLVSAPGPQLRSDLRLAEHSQPRNSRAIVFPGSIWASAAAAVLLLVATRPAVADTITFNSQAVSPIALAPSSDTLSLNSQTGTVDTNAGPFMFQTGDFVIGDSEIPDQVMTFSFQDTITLNGITQTLTLNGQDAVTQTADTLTIFGGTPVTFGDKTFAIQNFTLSEGSMGDFSVALEAAAVTPEPSSLLLLGTGILVGALLLSRRTATPKA